MTCLEPKFWQAGFGFAPAKRDSRSRIARTLAWRPAGFISSASSTCLLRRSIAGLKKIAPRQAFGSQTSRRRRTAKESDAAQLQIETPPTRT